MPHLPGAAQSADVSHIPDVAVPAPLARRLLALIYEALLLTALLWCAGLVYSAIEARALGIHSRLAFQVYVVLVTGAYFVWQWTHGGRTLPMKTWRIRLVTIEGDEVRALRAWARYGFALAGTLAAGFSFAWALFDRDRQFLHDRLAGTRLVKSDPVTDR